MYCGPKGSHDANREQVTPDGMKRPLMTIRPLAEVLMQCLLTVLVKDQGLAPRAALSELNSVELL